MKKMFSVLSFVLCIAMLGSLICVPAFAGTSDEWSENFDSWDLSKGVAQKGFSMLNDEAITNGGPVKLEGDSHNVVLQVPTCGGGLQTTFGKTSGIWEFSMDFYKTQTSKNSFIVRFGPEGVANTGVDSITQIFRAADKVCLDEISGNWVDQYKVTNWDAASWYTLKSIIDLDNKAMKTQIFNGNDMVGERLYSVRETSDLTNLYLTTWDSETPVYIDNLSLKPYTGDAITECEYFYNFESSDNGANLSTLPQWGGVRNNTSATAVVDGTTFEGKKVAKTNNDNTNTAAFVLPYTVKKGYIKVSSKMYIDDSARVILNVVDEKSNATRFIQSKNFTTAGEIKTFGLQRLDNDKSSFVSVKRKEWYDVETVIDVEKMVRDVKVMYNGKVIGLDLDMPIVGLDNNVKRLYFESWGGNVYYDEVKVSVSGDKYKRPEDKTVINETFDGMTTDDDLNTNGWAIKSSKTGVDNGAVVVHNDNNTTEGKLEKYFGNDDWNKIRFSYDVKWDGVSRPHIMIQGANNSGGDIYILSHITNGKLLVASSDAGDSINTVATDLERDDVVSVDVTVDRAKKSADYKIKINGVDKDERSAKIEKVFNGPLYVRFANWAKNSAMSVDNVKIELLDTKPVIASGGIKATDVEGNAVELVGTSVTPGIKTISVDFGTTVTSESLADAVTLKGGEDTRTLDGVVDGQKAVFTLDKVLKENTPYELVVSGDVANEKGATMGNNYKIEFTTGAYDVKVTSNAVKATSGIPVTTIGDLSANAKLTLDGKVVNSSDKDEKVTYIAAYYNGNILKYAEAKEINVLSGSSVVPDVTFTVPSDITDVTSVKIMTWNTTIDMKPLCGVIPIQ